MSPFDVDDIADAASARLGSAYQRAALARRTPRDALNRYQPTRAPWAHGFWPGQDHRFGKWHPADAPLAELLESLPPETCQQAYERLLARRRELEALGYVFERPVPNACVLPTPPEPGPGPTPRPPRPPVPPRPPTPRPPLDSDAYTILDTGGVVALNLDIGSVTSGLIAYRQGQIPAPSYVVSIHASAPGRFGDSIRTTIEVPQLGFMWAYDSGPSNVPAESGELNLPIGLLLLHGGQLIVRMEPAQGGVSVDSCNANGVLVYRNVRLRRPLAPPPGDVVTELPCLDEDTFDELANAGIDLTGYQRGCPIF
jgi:hypothetical protein